MCDVSLRPTDFDCDVEIMSDMLVYSSCITVFTNAKDMSREMYHFSFTQQSIDERCKELRI